MKTMTILLMAGLALSACGGADAPVSEQEIAPEPTTEGSYTVTVDSLEATMPVVGTVQARHRAEISTRLMARVTDVPVDLGDQVRGGQILIRLGVEDVEASLTRADAAATAARAAREEASRQAARMDTLLAADAVARVQRDQAHLALAQTESQLAMAEATLREVEAAAGYARIEAPFDGVVVARMVDAGDLAAPGVPLLTIESAGTRDVVVAVPPEAAERLAEGGEIEVVARDGRTAVGSIRAIAGGADPTTRTVEVRAQISAEWPTGTSVTAFVPTGERAAVTIPADAVVRRGQLTGVNVVEGEVELLRWVRLGRASGDRVEVLSGLAPGERIAR
jgi:RND family efflux transporter MFP subunit